MGKTVLLGVALLVAVVSTCTAVSVHHDTHRVSGWKVLKGSSAVIASAKAQKAAQAERSAVSSGDKVPAAEDPRSLLATPLEDAVDERFARRIPLVKTTFRNPPSSKDPEMGPLGQGNEVEAKAKGSTSAGHAPISTLQSTSQYHRVSVEVWASDQCTDTPFLSFSAKPDECASVSFEDPTNSSQDATFFAHVTVSNERVEARFFEDDACTQPVAKNPSSEELQELWQGGASGSCGDSCQSMGSAHASIECKKEEQKSSTTLIVALVAVGAVLGAIAVAFFVKW